MLQSRLSPLLVTFFAAGVMADCTRQMLEEMTQRYIASQTTGQLAWLQKVFHENSTYRENGKILDITKGILSQPLKVDYSKSILDDQNCATYTELIVTDPKNPYVIGTQIRHNGTGALGYVRVALVDSIVSGPDAWLFNASHSLHYALSENWTTIAPEKRDSREALKDAADAYLDLWGNHTANATTKVPWGTPCARLEGSLYTGKGFLNDTCNLGVPSGSSPPNIDRRYVIDETKGSVSVLCTFQTMNNAPDSHEFRLEGGKLRYVHTMTVCPEANCGLKRPEALRAKMLAGKTARRSRTRTRGVVCFFRSKAKILTGSRSTG